MHTGGTHPSSDRESCKCHAQVVTQHRTGHSALVSRLKGAETRAETLLKAKLGEAKWQLHESHVHIFDRGFGVGAWAATESQLVIASVGAVDRVPIHATVTFDLSFFNGKNKDDILWIELNIASPGSRVLRAPLRGIGVLRDPESGHLLRVEDFELATDLLGDIDLGDVAKAIGCILACVGLFCGLVCAPACVAIIACIACLGACVGAELEAFLICVEACHIAVGNVSA
jgi:hypothetical protein